MDRPVSCGCCSFPGRLGWITLLSCCLVIAACGDGSRDTESVEARSPYTGNVDPAVISRENASATVASVLLAHQLLVSNYGAFPTSQAPAETATIVGRSPGLLFDIRTRHEADIRARLLDRDFAARTATIETRPCDDGSVLVELIQEEFGTGLATLDFMACRYGDYSYDGHLDLAFSEADPVRGYPTRGIYELTEFRVSSNDFVLRFDGRIEATRELGAHMETLVVPDMYILDESSGSMTMLHNFSSRVLYRALLTDEGGIQQLGGQLFESTRGLVDASTMEELDYRKLEDVLPVNGQLYLRGMAGSSIRVEMLYGTHVRLEIDFDGDQNMDAIGVLDWLGLFSGQSLQDSDGDGMHDLWEYLHLLNPFFDFDAALDYDGDGRTNLEEYLSATNPWDAQSF